MRSVSTRCTKGPRAHADRMAPTRAASSRACSGAAKQALKTLGPKPLLVLPQQDSFLLAFFWGEGHRNLSEFGHTQKKNLQIIKKSSKKGNSSRHVWLREFAPLRNIWWLLPRCQGVG